MGMYEFTYYDVYNKFQHIVVSLKEEKLQSAIDNLEKANSTHIMIFDAMTDVIIYDDGEFF